MPLTLRADLRVPGCAPRDSILDGKAMGAGWCIGSSSGSAILDLNFEAMWPGSMGPYSYSYKACMLRVMPNFASGLHEEVLMLPQMHALMYAACQCRQDM